MDHLFFYYDWIFDLERAIKWRQISWSLFCAENDLGMQEIGINYINLEGYKVRKIVIRVLSHEDLERFSKTVEEWGFNWHPLPMDDPFFSILNEVTEAHWNVLDQSRKDYPYIMSNASLPGPTDTQEWKAAQHNELLRKKLRREKGANS